MKNAQLNWVRLPIENIRNCRELGGYNTEFGQQTRWHSFLRSSDMSRINNEDITFLLDYGVRTVIDLRRKDEIEQHPNPMSKINTVDYFNISLSTGSIANIMKEIPNSDITIDAFYIRMLKKDQAIKDIFNTIYQAKEGCILFNCQAGKDRTGVLAMLLLGLAEVEKKDIIANYEVTYTNLEIKYQEKYKHLPKDFLLSKGDYIIKPYDYILSEYGSFYAYFQSVGLEKEVINGVKERMIEGLLLEDSTFLNC